VTAMSWIRRLVLHLRATFLFGRLQREMDEEMRAHLEQATDRLMARGLTRSEAMVAARAEFGNSTVLASDAREARGALWLESAVTDLRLALRGLKRSPLFAAVAILSIGIGVGATTAIVTIADALLLKGPPGVGHPERIVTVGRTHNGHGFDTFSYQTSLDYAKAPSLTDFAAIDLEPKALAVSGELHAEAVQSGAVSGAFFRVLDARPALGRFFTPGEDSESNAAPLVVLSNSYWHKRFHGDSTILGRTIDLNAVPFTVVGVAAPGFQGPFVIAPDLWIPIRAQARLTHNESMLTSRDAVWLVGIGRLGPGRSLGQVQAELAAIAARLRQTYPNERDIEGVRVARLSLVPGEGHDVIGGFMLALFVVAILVLVVASTNVAGMLLARAAVRQREIAVRIAMGASRSRLVRLLVAESLVLGAAAGVVGVALANALVKALMTLVPKLPVPIVVHPMLDGLALEFSLSATLVTAVVVGALPALESTKPDLVPALKTAAGGTAQRHRLRSVLLVSQIAVSMLLLVVASLFGRSLLRARAIDPGFATKGISFIAFDLGLAGYDEARGMDQAPSARRRETSPERTSAILERVRRVPGVSDAAFAGVIPLSGSGRGYGPIVVDGHPAPNGQPAWEADWDVVTERYFDVMSIPLVSGRVFAETDRNGGADVAILNETFARKLFGASAAAVGRTLRSRSRTLTVVGVARDAKYRWLDDQGLSYIYVPAAQWYDPHTNLLTRASGGVDVDDAVRRAVTELDPRLPILDQRTMDDQVATSTFPQRFALWVSGSLGLVALLLALLGIYGVIAYSVAQRTREIGVRAALGARPRTIAAMVLRHGLALAAVGVLAGASVALAATRLLASYLFGVPPSDPLAYAAAALLLAGAALAASWLPAWRAARTDPMNALRSE